jgi:NAD(P)-dependent dehydrogenase (short-subunit alcohol dehydrogenase family)
MYNPFSLEGKKILITGASSGIGRITAITCSKMGAKIVISGRNPIRLQETYISLIGSGHLKIVADLINSEEFSLLVEKIPPLDGIVHCAGLHKYVLCKLVKESDYNQIMRINFEVPIMLIQTLFKSKLIKKNASIVFISSIAADNPSVGTVLYGASKAALNSAMRSFALEFAPSKIRVNCISPGMVRTDFILKHNENITREQLDELEKNYPLGYGNPEDVAEGVVFLLSNASKWMTGTNLKLDGGVSLK